MKHFNIKQFLLALTLLIAVSGTAQTADVVNNWTVPNSVSLMPATSLRIKPSKYYLMQLDTSKMRATLAKAPMEFTSPKPSAQLKIALPMPDGRMASFKIEMVQTMAPALAAKYPTIKTYGGQGIDDPTAVIRLDFTDMGFHAMVLSDKSGSYFIDPAYQDNQLIYLSYFKKDLKKNEPFIEGLVGSNLNLMNNGPHPAAKPPVATCVATQLRTYRTAVACTGEYAVAATGKAKPTVAQTLACIVTSVNRVTGIYEKEIDVRLQLIANEDTIVFTNAATDPFTGNNNANVLINESQTNITNYIGSPNFDIGHTFSTGGGGLAQVGCVCQDASKASGITGSPSPVGDAYDVDYVAHEMGHEFGGEHPFNATTGSCSGNGTTDANAEPGSGSTIMAYAGICGTNDLQPHSDAIFQAVSYDEIVNYTNLSNGNTCAVITKTGNNAPVVYAGSDYTIPISTPFTLTGSGIDPDGDTLTYCWEETNTGGPFGDWNKPSGDAPIFRTFNPLTIPSRTFPQMSDVVNNTTTIGEILPSYARVLEFRLTARDNRSSGGGLCHGIIHVTVANTGAAFAVTYPNKALSWTVGTYQNATWNVSNTNLSPIECGYVAVELSTDGGYTYPITLVDSTPNNGSAQVLVPNNVTTQARVRVRALGNVFFDISNANFTIVAAKQASYSVGYPAAATICPGGTASFKVSVQAIDSFNSPVMLSASALPAGTTVAFSKNNIVPNDSVVVTLSNTAGLTTGNYSFTLTVNGNSIVQTRTLSFSIVSINTTTFKVAGLLPANKATSQPVQPTFTWSFNANAASYDFVLATDSLFTNIVESVSVTDSFYVQPTSLNAGTAYYWQVRPVAAYCGGINGQFFTPLSFATGASRCNTLTKTTATTISATGTPTVNSNVTEPTDSTGVITDINVLNVNITHPAISDLKISLLSPKGTTVVLANGVCDTSKNMLLSFDDQSTIITVPCPPTTGQSIKPFQPLSTFNGENAYGVWRLRIFDQYAGNGGTLNSWGLQICRTAVISLPVTWESFTAKKQDDNAVLLNWTTANEENNLMFYVEKSTDGINFNSIATFKGAASSQTINDYQYVDGSLNNGIIYYRIKQVDINGRGSYSKVVSVVFATISKVSLYPNPAKDKVTIQSVEKITQVQLYAINGKLIYTGKPNTNNTSIELNNCVPGTYTISILTATDVITKKLVIQK